jgi:lysophosphatidylglycerol acyltransferase 1
VFKYTNFGIISWFHEDFFILAGKAARESSLENLRSHLERSFAKKERKYLVLFPEGGFLRKRKVSRIFYIYIYSSMWYPSTRVLIKGRFE